MKILTGILSIISALCIAGSMLGLMKTFEYPKIIRKNPIYIMQKLNQAGKTVPILFYIFGIGGFLIVFTSIAFEQLEQGCGEKIFSEYAKICGIIYGILLFVGILRYTKLFPHIAELMKENKITDQTAGTLYQLANIYIGDTVCEHIAFLFLSVMILFNSISLLLTNTVAIGWSIAGIVTSVGLIIGNTEFLGYKKMFAINRIFSSLSIVWFLAIGINLVL